MAHNDHPSANWPRKNLALYSLYLPVTDNNGDAVSPQILQRVYAEIVRLAGGCTLLPPGDGFWIAGDGHLYHDRVVQVFVVAPGIPETVWYLVKLGSDLAQLLSQHEIFMHSTPVYMVESLPHAWPVGGGEEAIFTHERVT